MPVAPRDWRKTPDIWRGRLERSMSDRQMMEELWRQCERLYRSGRVEEPYPESASKSADDEVVVNYIKGIVDAAFAQTSLKRPKLKVLPRWPEDDDVALKAEKYVNYAWHDYDFHEEFRDAWWDTLVLGCGWLKLTWEQVMPDEPEAPDPEVDLFGGFVPPPRLEPLVDRPRLAWIDPWMMWVDPDATSLRDARWVCQRVWRNAADVKADKDFDSKTRGAITVDMGDGDASDALHSGRAGERRNERKISLWEYWSIEDGEWGVFTDDSVTGGWLRKPEPIPYSAGHPYEYLFLYKPTRHFYGLGEVAPLIVLQQELSQTRTQMIMHRRSGAAKYVARAGALSQEAKKALASDAPNVVAEVEEGHQGPITDVVQPVQQAQINPTAYAMSETIPRDMEYISAVTPNQHGVGLGSRATATEASIVQGHSTARARDKADRLERAARNVARRTLMAAEDMMLRSEAVPVEGDERRLEVIQPGEIVPQRPFRFDVEVGSMTPRDDTSMRAEAVQLLQSLGQFAHPGTVGTLDARRLIRMVLRSFGEEVPEEFFVEATQSEEPVGPDSQMTAGLAQQQQLQKQQQMVANKG